MCHGTNDIMSESGDKQLRTEVRQRCKDRHLVSLYHKCEHGRHGKTIAAGNNSGSGRSAKAAGDNLVSNRAGFRGATDGITSGATILRGVTIDQQDNTSRDCGMSQKVKDCRQEAQKILRRA
jgi:hypothetical protein